MSREQVGKARLNGSYNGERKQEVDLRMLNQHAKKINAEAQRLERDRLELMNQRQQTTQVTFGQRTLGSEVPSRQQFATDRSDRVERNFNRAPDNRKIRRLPDTISEEVSSRLDRLSPYESVQSLKAMIDKLVEESKVENEAVRTRLKEIQRKHQEVLNDMTNPDTKPNSVRPTALPEYPKRERHLITIEQIQSSSPDFNKPTKTDIDVGRVNLNTKHLENARQKTQPKKSKDSDSLLLEYTDEENNDTIEIDYRRDIAVEDSFATLNALEGRIFQEIISLRETKVKLMKQVNVEASNYNTLLEDFRQLEIENRHLKKRLQISEADAVLHVRREPSEVPQRQRPSYNERKHERGHDADRLEIENARLKDKLKKAAAFIEMVNLDGDGQASRGEDESQLQRNLRAAEAEIDRLEKELSNRQRTTAHAPAHHENEVHELRQALRKAQSNIDHLTMENRRLESRVGGGSEFQHKLDELRHENDILRKETIDMLRAVKSTRNEASSRPNASWASYQPTRHTYDRR